MKKHLPSRFGLSPERSTKGSSCFFSWVLDLTEESSLSEFIREYYDFHIGNFKYFFFWLSWEGFETFCLSESITRFSTLEEIISEQFIYSPRVISALEREKLKFERDEKFFYTHGK